MSNFLDNLLGGFAFGMLANNPFFGGCCGFGMYPMYGRVDFGCFANPFPSIFGNMGYMQSSAAMPMPTTFANAGFPQIDFTGVGQTIWDTYMNPDSEYNKQVRKMYESMNKQSEENKNNSQNNSSWYQMPFMQPQMITPWFTNNQKSEVEKDNDAEKDNEVKKNNEQKKVDSTGKKVSLEPEEKDSDIKKNNNSVITYDAKELKNKWSKTQPQLTDEFYSRVVEISRNVKCSPDDLMALMNLETKRTFSPSIKCGISSATGLIQFTNAAAQTLGTTTSALKKMSAVEQLEYVEKYLLFWKKKAGFKNDEQLTAGDLYALVAQPANAKKEVLIQSGTKEYDKNAKNWDVNKDNKITKSDLAACLEPFRA